MEKKPGAILKKDSERNEDLEEGELWLGGGGGVPLLKKILALQKSRRKEGLEEGVFSEKE